MASSDLQQQLEELKRQVEELRTARVEGAAAKPEEAPAPELDGAEAVGAREQGPLEQIEELVKLLEHELQDNPLLSGLAIFVAGLLVGRLIR